MQLAKRALASVENHLGAQHPENFSCSYQSG